MISLTQHLLAERQVVEQFLEETPQEDVLERNSWLSRLSVLDAEIEMSSRQATPARSTITYRGRPVVGSHGVASTFGLAATRAYTKIVQVVAAQWYRAIPLGERGRLKDGRKFDMLVIGPAYGSFGFELEEPSNEQLTLEDRSILTQSLTKTHALLQSTLASDDEITETITDLDERVLPVVRAFLTILKSNDATCAINSSEREFRFESIAQVARSLERLDTKNIKREEVFLEGEFQGARPTPRDFEFRVKEGGEIIVGKINPTVDDIAAINRKLYRPARVRAISHRVGNGRPRYLLIEQPQWLESADV